MNSMSIYLHPSKDGDFQVQFLLHLVEFFLQMFDSSKQVSSANSCTVERSNLKCKSLINIMKSRGPKTEPCGTPDLTKRIVELS